MKRTLCSIAACTLVLGALVSCGDKKGGKGKKETPNIVGKWAMSGFENKDVESAGIIFHENGKGSMYEDASNMFHFEDEGFYISGSVISNDYVIDEGDNVTVDVNGEKLLSMKKVDVKDGHYGTYTLEGGRLYDNFVESMKQDDGKLLDITLNFDGPHSELIFDDIFTYTIDDKNLNVSGATSVFNSQGAVLSGEYTIKDDKLTITDAKTTNVLTRVK